MAPPGPILSRALRLPARLYDIGAGPPLGHRFLLLTHRGRRSGQLHRTMLEVVRWDPGRHEATVMSGCSRLAGFRYDGSAEARDRLVEALPLLGLGER